MDEPRYKPKPMILAVSKVSESDFDYISTKVEVIIDLQIPEATAKELRDMLTRKIDVEVYGAVSIRLKGRLIL